jgi:cystathionine gamma-synthase
MDKYQIATRAIHAGRRPDAGSGAISPGITLSTNFLRQADGSHISGYSYSRASNPNRTQLEECLASLEGGASAVAFSSGTAAALSVFSLLETGDELLACRDSYHGTLQQLDEVVSRWGVVVRTIDTTDIDVVKAAIGPTTRLLWVESPTNPLLRICDIAALAELAKENNLILACDNTFATPVLQNPLALGADLVIHSATKYLGGHSDLTGGVVVSGDEDENIAWVRKFQVQGGAIPSTFDCWLLLRSLATLPLRVSAQSRNASRLAEYLLANDNVSKVYYPGLASHPGHKLAARQMRDFGAMLSFCSGENSEQAMAVLGRLKLMVRATSLGGVETLIEHRASIEGPRTLAPDNMLRVSVGAEDPDDLIADLDQALN